MLRRATKLIGSDIVSPDGVVGTVYDLLFDEGDWAFRYLVVDIGKWLKGRRLLLSIDEVEEVDEDQREVRVPLGKSEIAHCPGAASKNTASEEAKALIGRYWMWTPASVEHLPQEVSLVLDFEATDGEKEEAEGNVRSRLRSVRETEGYHIAATDGDIGHLKDLLVDDDTWQIRYLAINAGSWLFQRNVLVPSATLESIHWADRRVHLSVLRDAVRHSPEYDPDEPLGPAYEQALDDHYVAGDPK
jgi:sporulation protein YlmC with PRC-barrel domain